jgi:photosystem II stability/assembly factor-like uncharacterized protein
LIAASMNTKPFFYFLLVFFMLAATSGYGQMRNTYTDQDPSNEVQNFSFYNVSEGYVAFSNWIGFTQDSGHTFVNKYITWNNVNFNNQFVNLTFGFTINGVHAFSHDTLIVYGNYGWAPSILYSVDGGNSFLLSYYQPFNQSFFYNGVFTVSFPSHATGYAIIEDKILKTSNKGLSWSTVYNTAVKDLFLVQFVNDNTGYAFGSSQFLKTTNAGASWQNIPKPNEPIHGGYFLNANTGWLSQSSLYQTLDGGLSWTQKNEPYYGVSNPLHFTNDSTGYFLLAFDVWKTTDSGRVWERLERDNNYEYLSYGHNNFYFQNSDTFWAGGGHGFIERTTNAGGTTIPKAIFVIDLTQLANNHKIILTNKTKRGYNYRWFKNSVLLSTDYNTEYITNRLTIDTIRLVVQKGNYTDTSTAIIDTRDNPHICYASFQTSVDTAAVKFNNTDTAYGVKHYWYFGDGAVDSVQAKPLHFYNAVGNYTVGHVVYNTIDHCRDSSAQIITIIRTRKCLVADFTFTPDPFFTNRLLFSFSYDHTAESGNNALLTTGVNWGDGSTVLSANPHTFDSAKYYNVCFSIKNYYTGCISTVCKPVPVQMPTSCQADFLINNLNNNFPPAILFSGKPVAYPTGKRNSWMVNNWQITATGNNPNFQTSFFKRVLYPYFTTGDNYCDNWVNEISLDSLNKTMTHTMYDSLSGCTDVITKNFTVQRGMNIYIKAVPYPGYPQYASFYAYQLSGQGDTIYYNTVWHIEGPGANFYQGSYSSIAYKLTYTFPYPGDYKVCIATNTCINGVRQVYYITYHVNPDPCGIFPPDFSFAQGANNLVTFYPVTGNPATNAGNWYWGDSTSSPVDITSHNYYVGGMYNVMLKYTSPTGCVKSITQSVFVEISCNGNRIWLDSELPQPPSGIFGYQWQVNDGSGWTNVPNSGIYLYPTNNFTAGPTQKRLTITGAPPSYNGYQYRCTNNGGTSYKYFTIRFTSKWTGTVSNAWENPANWSCGFIPDQNTTVVIPSGTANAPVISSNAAIYNLVVNSGAVLNVMPGFTLTVLH